MMKPLRIGMVAGEYSGDLLGAGLIQALRQLHPNLIVEGIAGPRMIAAGCHPLYDMEQLSVMGVLEVLKRLPTILSIRRKLLQRFLINPPDIFIGIDAPDFNLALEEKLKKAGIPIVHYVSPSVWAWKQGRIKKIKRTVDRMLSILPFEEKFYQQYQVPVHYVGHPLADAIPFHSDQQKARDQLGLPHNRIIIALLPGSRSNEIKFLGKLFLKTALQCQQKLPEVMFVAPMVNEKLHQQFMVSFQKIAPQLPLQIIDGQAHKVMAAANLVLLASGTASLEAMLIKRPMVVAYRMSALSFLIAKCMIKTPYIALPNLLTGKEIVPEFIQKSATVKNLTAAIFDSLNDSAATATLIAEFSKIHQTMNRNTNQLAAEAVLELIATDNNFIQSIPQAEF